MAMTHKERWERRREKEREQKLQKEAEEALLLQQYLRRKQAERELLEGEDRRAMTEKLPTLLSQADLKTLQEGVTRITASPALLDYVQRLLEQSRRMPGLLYGLSPRAGLGLVRAAKAWALMEGRNHVLPDDIQAVFPAVAAHRLEQGESGKSAERVRQLLATVSVLE